MLQNANRRPNTYKLLLLPCVRQKAEELGMALPDQQTLLALAERAGALKVGGSGEGNNQLVMDYSSTRGKGNGLRGARLGTCASFHLLDIMTCACVRFPGHTGSARWVSPIFSWQCVRMHARRRATQAGRHQGAPRQPAAGRHPRPIATMRQQWRLCASCPLSRGRGRFASWVSGC